MCPSMCPYAAEETWIDADAAMTPPPDLEERGHAPEGSYEGALAALDATVPTAPALLPSRTPIDILSMVSAFSSCCCC